MRNLLFNWNVLSGEKYPLPIISIGNLSVGGTGKTPHTEYLVRLLKEKYRVAVLSRGYKRKTSGFILATTTSTCKEIGDEPFQIKKKYPDILVAVDADRRRGIRKLLALSEQQRPEVILLDDAFQHRYVIPSLSILLTDYNRPFYDDRLLPTGRLREPIDGVFRADVVIVTKCKEDMTPLELRIIEENMHLMAHQMLFFSHIHYGELQPLYPKEAISKKSLRKLHSGEEILLVSGIASPAPFIQKVKEYTNKVTVLSFPDHHSFTKQDFNKIQQVFDRLESSHKWMLVTEKDASRLWDNPLMPKEWKKYLYFLPINIEFKQQPFDNMIIKHIQSYEQQNRNLNIR